MRAVALSSTNSGTTVCVARPPAGRVGGETPTEKAPDWAPAADDGFDAPAGAGEARGGDDDGCPSAGEDGLDAGGEADAGGGGGDAAAAAGVVRCWSKSWVKAVLNKSRGSEDEAELPGCGGDTIS